MLRVGVLAHAPIGGRCKPGLLEAYGAGWVAGLYASMLRDTLDGLQAIDADDYVVFTTAEEDALSVLARHVPAPWRLVDLAEPAPAARLERALSSLLGDGGRALLVVSDAPSCPTEPLAAALAKDWDEGGLVLGPSEDGGVYAFATTALLPEIFRDAPFGTPALLPLMRARCIELGVNVRELPTWYDVDRPSDVLRLQDELRRFPERAPRTAQYFVTAR